MRKRRRLLDIRIAEMAEPEINAFLTHLAVKESVSASTQNQALSALLFLYRYVLDREVGDLAPEQRKDELESLWLRIQQELLNTERA